MTFTPQATSSSPLRTAHRVVLGLLVLVCAWIASQPSVGPGMPPASLTVTALALAVGLIFARALTRSSALPAAARPFLAAFTLLCALGIGVTALATATAGEARDTALGFALGGLSLALRGPNLETPPPRGR